MAQSRLDPLQERVLLVLAGACPGWRLTGGAALAGFHLGHRTTRDLRDVGALLAHGGDLDRAVADAPRKDGGFSALTLAWVLENLDVQGIGSVAGVTSEALGDLDRVRKKLVDRLLRVTRPE